MPSELDWLYNTYGHDGDILSYYDLAKELERSGNLRISATAYDLAYGLDPKNKEIARARKTLLDRLSIVENGIRFRYIPSGTFLMGSDLGDPDEQPIHPVKVDEYWLSETPVSWVTFADLMNLELPKDFYALEYWGATKGTYPNKIILEGTFFLREYNKIRMGWCANGVTYSEEWNYYQKPMVSVSWQEVEELCKKITTANVIYRLPTEAEWEKAARGGLINCVYSWGNEQPNKDNCDYDRFHKFSILPMQKFPPNNYGLYAMNGCVWEWTSDWYDASYYANSPKINPKGPVEGDEKVMRGGSWADCSEAVTDTFRMSRRSRSWRDDDWGDHRSPNIGFRLCRVEHP